MTKIALALLFASSSFACSGSGAASDTMPADQTSVLVEKDDGRSTRDLLEGRYIPKDKSAELMQAAPPTMLVTTNCQTPADRAPAFVAAFRGLQGEMCACQTRECGQQVEARFRQLHTDYGEMAEEDLTTGQNRALLALAMQMATCRSKLANSQWSETRATATP